MAEGLTRHLLSEQGLAGVVSSAGVGAPQGRRPSRHGADILRERGICIDAHRSRQLTPEILAEADLVIALEEEHRLAITDISGGENKRILLLSEWAGEPYLGPGVDDPYMGSRQDYEATAREIEGYIRRALEKF
ncbi:MAG: hypothetical protein GY835_06955 [bacterium]|nr:hypothetical protein [bacterium]